MISVFPFSPQALVKEQTPFVCRTFSKAQKHGINIHAFGSESAIVMRMSGKTIIFYNETKPTEHISYSILHEMGHPIIQHDFNTTDPETYGRYEVETNYFAAQLLMPAQILREFQRRGMSITPQFLQQNFGVSGDAAQRRIHTLSVTNEEWRSKSEREYDDIILMKYDAFINKVCPRPFNPLYSFDDELDRQRVRDSWYA